MTIAVRSPFLKCSMRARACIWMLPCPVVYAWRMPAVPRMIAAVGKSGPGSTSMRSSIVAPGRPARSRQASMTSPRLCGGMLVAIPTAMPDEPLTSRLGKRAGSTRGSWREPS